MPRRLITHTKGVLHNRSPCCVHSNRFLVPCQFSPLPFHARVAGCRPLPGLLIPTHRCFFPRAWLLPLDYPPCFALEIMLTRLAIMLVQCSKPYAPFCVITHMYDMAGGCGTSRCGSGSLCPTAAYISDSGGRGEGATGLPPGTARAGAATGAAATGTTSAGCWKITLTPTTGEEWPAELAEMGWIAD